MANNHSQAYASYTEMISNNGDFKDAFWPTETATSRAAYCSRQAPGSANGSMSVNTDGNKKKSGKGNSKGKTKESKKNKNK